MADETPSGEGSPELESRAPERGDLVALCAHLNACGANYVVLGGFAEIFAGLPRTTGDIDLLMDSSLDNEAKIFKALEILPDQAVKELKPGDIELYSVVRVADEITIGLMSEASGVNFAEASGFIVWRELDGVSIPFASPELLWKMKSRSRRDKDAGDLAFLAEWFKAQGKSLPS